MLAGAYKKIPHTKKAAIAVSFVGKIQSGPDANDVPKSQSTPISTSITQIDPRQITPIVASPMDASVLARLTHSASLGRSWVQMLGDWIGVALRLPFVLPGDFLPLAGARLRLGVGFAGRRVSADFVLVKSQRPEGRHSVLGGGAVEPLRSRAPVLSM